LKKIILNKRLVIIDRDGCINAPRHDLEYIHQEKDFHLYSDALDFCREATSLGIRLAIATNQQGIGKNMFSLEDVYSLHQVFLRKLPLDDQCFPIYVCPHLSNDSFCDCRKPKPGLLFKAMAYFNAPPKTVLFIGDSFSDKVAAERAGIDFCYLDRQNKFEFFSEYRTNTLSLSYLEARFK
jgi:D-glycero-D-manno-heptose 1,7-bisphosphate phosphatase